MIRLKDGVSLAGLTTQALLAMRVAEAVYAEHDRVLWITSVNDGLHSATSLHHSGNAFDIRLWNIVDKEHEAELLVAEIKSALGIDFDVVLEWYNAEDGTMDENSHIHIEYQPRQRREI